MHWKIALFLALSGPLWAQAPAPEGQCPASQQCTEDQCQSVDCGPEGDQPSQTVDGIPIRYVCPQSFPSDYYYDRGYSAAPASASRPTATRTQTLTGYARKPDPRYRTPTLPGYRH